ncbi:PREDICTED: major histocompatibility complex class I-related gene protein-like [Thamnophis sirtalis]|uniref:Major histocompatibility complex class I-related gene protein-like n=1 Tax=Thamnophis sirtalis TaxID=35019 RepID=A0A6I9XNN9_9SAUR|nr:PREDICTED: major histocompatibility complex class I-related gene protein-like [Thamnophis sirtalis]
MVTEIPASFFQIEQILFEAQDSHSLFAVADSGLHTWQRMSGCELRGDGSKGGFWQYGYEGRTFITFDKETLTWVTPDPQAQITQRKRDAIPGYNQRWKDYLEEICIEWLEKYLSYGEETLLRTEAWSSLRFREQKSRRGGKK